MPHPVPIPSGQLTVSDAETARAEALVAALTQIIRYGTTGATTNTPRTDGPAGPGNQIAETVLATGPQQLFLRQLALAFATTIADLANASTIGITRLSSDPDDPLFPTALNAEEVDTVPGVNLVPRARADGTIDPAWIGLGSGPNTAVVGTFSGVCLSSAAVGDIVYVSGAGKQVRLVDITDAAKIPGIGCITSKPSSTSCVVQCHGLVSGVYGALVPGKQYVIGTDGRPTAVLPVPGVGQSLFIQPVGMALDTDMMLIQPINAITKIRG